MVGRYQETVEVPIVSAPRRAQQEKKLIKDKYDNGPKMKRQNYTSERFLSNV